MGEFFADQGLFVYSKLCNRKVPHSSQLGTGGYDDLRYIRSLERDYDTVWGSMVWDATRGVVVYHGGAPGTGSTPASNETWEWNGVTWYQASSAGPARCASPMAYNPVFLRTEMVGGALLANRQQTTDGNWIYGF